MTVSVRRLAIGVLALSAGLPMASKVAAQSEPPSAESAGSLFGPDNGPKGNAVVVKAQFTAPSGNKQGQLFIIAAVEPGWHIYSITQPPGGPVATKIEVSSPPGVRVGGEFRSSVVARDQ